MCVIVQDQYVYCGCVSKPKNRTCQRICMHGVNVAQATLNKVHDHCQGCKLAQKTRLAPVQSHDELPSRRQHMSISRNVRIEAWRKESSAKPGGPHNQVNFNMRPKLNEQQRWLRKQRREENRAVSGRAKFGYASMPRTVILRGAPKKAEKMAVTQAAEILRA